MKSLPILSPFVAAMLFFGCIQINVPPVRVGGGGAGGGSQGGTSSGGGGWRDVVAGVAGGTCLGAEQGVLFYAFDTLAYPGEPVDLAVRVQSARSLKGIEGVRIGIYQGERLLALAKTDGNGVAGTRWTPPAAGDYKFTARILAPPQRDGDDLENIDRVTPTPLLVAARAKKTEFVIIDLDHTLVDAGFFRVLFGDGAPAMADSVRVTRRIAGRYTIIYLTHRPDLLTRKSKAWLTENGYPAGALLVSELKEAFGDSGKFKTARLAAVRESFPNVRIGIGDKPSDAQAYVDNALTAYLIPHYKQDKPKDMRKAAEEIRELRGRGRLHVVGSWREIEAGIFDGKVYPPESFARWLDARADRLEAEEKARKKDDD